MNPSQPHDMIQSTGWPKFHFKQEDLYARSREPSITEREYYPGNHVYASAEILRQYAGLPSGEPVPWAIQAVMNFYRPQDLIGLSMEDLKMHSKLKSANLPCSFVFTEHLAARLRDGQIQNVNAIGHIFFYARELFRRRGLDDPSLVRKGTIALPDKSDLNRQLDFDREAYAAKLVALPEEYQPVYVSMHWRDFDRGCHEPYLRAGLKVVSSGHPYEPLFYERLYDILRQFKYACSNEISTSFALSVMSGCRFFYLDGGDVTIVRPSRTYAGPEPMLTAPGRQACVNASPFPPEESLLEIQQQLAATYTGHASLRPPEYFTDRWETDRASLLSRANRCDFDPSSNKSPIDLASWLCHGMDFDGWADQVAGLTIPSQDGSPGVKLILELPCAAETAKPASLSIMVNGSPPQQHQWSRGSRRLTLTIPSTGDGTNIKILLHGPDPRPLTGESRIRSFRLAAIKRQDNVSPDTPEVVATKPSSSVAGWIHRLLRRHTQQK